MREAKTWYVLKARAERDLYDAVGAFAGRHRITVTKAIRELLTAGLESYKDCGCGKCEVGVKK